MSDPTRFLHALGQALASMTLYGAGHPARERTVDMAFRELTDLQKDNARALFTFLDDETVFGQQPLREMKSWDWGLRLSQAGIQRLEFSDDVTRDDFEGFLDEALARLTLAAIGTGDARQMRRSNIRFGAVGLKGESAPAPQSGVPVTVSMAEEVATLSWLQEQVQGGRGLPLLEAEAIVRSLSIAMHGGQRIILPMLHLKEFDQYTTTHSLNVSVLAMALAEFMGHGPRAIQAIGMAGLLHDLGKIRVPRDILTKPGKLTPEERAVMNRHPIDGARLILEDERQLDLAAVVAYEHHVMIDGGGYPTFRFARDCHEASKLVHVCDVFDALRTNRPYRDAWATERAIGYVAERSNIEFAPAVADAFARMMTAYEHQVTVLPAATATATVEPSRPPPLAPPAS